MIGSSKRESRQSVVLLTARNEWRRRRRETALVVLTAGFLLFAAGAIAIASIEAELLRETQRAAQETDQLHWVNQGPANPHSAAHFGRYAFKPVDPLYFLDAGEAPFLGVAVWIEAHNQNPFLFRPAEDFTELGRSGIASLAGLLQLAAPLLLGGLAVSALAEDRASGVLRLGLSQGADPREIVLGIGLTYVGAATGLLLTVAAFAATAAALQFGWHAPWLRLALWFFGHLVYVLVFVAIAMLVASKARTASGGQAALVGLWLVLCVISPRALAEAAERAHPTPNRVELRRTIEQDLAEGVDGHNPESERTKALQQRLFDEYGVNRVEDLPVDFTGVAMLESERYGNDVYDARWRELWEVFEAQNRLRSALSLLSPLEAIRRWSAALAGTDFEHHRRFALAAEQYRRVLNEELNQDLARHGAGQGRSFRREREFWESNSRFEYRGPRLRETLGGQGSNVASLLLWLTGVSGAVWAVSRRLEV